MGHNLRLPDDYFFPAEINGWEYDPGPYNGEAWFSPDRTQSVVAFNCTGSVRAQIYDERCRGFQNYEPVVERRDVPEPDTDDIEKKTEAHRQANADLLEEMFDWMRENAPGEWEHALVNEAVFDAPPGFELTTYDIEARQDHIKYEREEPDEDYRVEYLTISGYRASGNYEAKHIRFPKEATGLPRPQDELDVPEERDLDIALSVVRSYARDLVDGESRDMSGQTSLKGWSA